MPQSIRNLTAAFSTVAVARTPRRSEPPAALNEHTTRIKELIKTVATSAIALGVELKTVRDSHFPISFTTSKKTKAKGKTKSGKTYHRPGWKQYLEQNFKMTMARAWVLIEIADRFRYKQINYKLSAGVLQALLPKDVTEEIERAIVEENERIVKESGGKKKLTVKKARALVKKKLREARGEKETEEPKETLPKPKEAKRIASEARERGQNIMVLASDNNYYTGATDEEADEYAQRRHIVFEIERVIDFICNLSLTPHELLSDSYAPLHQRWWVTDQGARVSAKGHHIADAARWLAALSAAVESIR
jgi:hypothetical protein